MADRGAPAYWVAVRKEGATGEPLDLTNRVEAVHFVDHERKADKLQLRVNNFDLANFDDPIWAQGNIIQFAFGYESGLSPVREMVIRQVKGSTTLNIVARSKDVLMDRIKRRHAYENVTRSDVVRQIANRNGYLVDNLILGTTEERFEIITQNNLTDAQMLRKLAHQEGYEFFVDFDGLHWHERDLEQAPNRELIYYTDPGQGDIKDYSVDNDITRKPGRVRVKSRNPLTGETITGLADNETDQSRAILQEVKALEELILNIDEVTGEVKESTRIIPPTQSAAQETDIASNAQTAEEAQTEARRRFRKATQNAVKMTLNIVGDPNMLAKSVVQVSGMGKRLSGKYYVKAVESMLGAGSDGFAMKLTLITDGFQKRQGAGNGKTGANTGALAAAIADLVTAAASVITRDPLRQATNVAKAGSALVKAGAPSTSQFLSLAQQATRGAGTAKTFAKKAIGPEVPALNNLAAAFTQVATIARSLASAVDKEAKGKANTKKVGDKRTLQQRLVVDKVTGAATTKFVESRARGQK